jgi:hypothetical protein
MRRKDMEAEEEKINYLALYHFNFSNESSFFDISKLNSLFEVPFGHIFIGSTKQSFRE